VKVAPRLGGVLLWLAMTASLPAGSATWLLDPTSSDWNTPANWTPPSVPNGPADTATFDVSNQTAVSVSSSTEVNEVAFTSGANLFEITINPLAILTISGTGMVNDSGQIQKFVTIGGDSSDAEINFINSANAGTLTRITNAASGIAGGVARTRFEGDSSAGEAVILNEGSTADVVGGNGVTLFGDDSSAADSTITNTGATVSGAANGVVFFHDHATAARAILTGIPGVEGTAAAGGINFADKTSAGSARLTNLGGRSENAPGAGSRFQEQATAANSTIVNEGGVALNAGGGFTSFFDNSTADNSSLIANTGIAGGQAGFFAFFDDSGGGTARVTLLGGGALYLDGHNSPGMKIGSLDGSGLVFLGPNRLTVGANNLDTTFSGVIDDSALGGTLRKIGDGGLVLSGANTYTGGTFVSRGNLIVNNTTGSGTGTGPIEVDAGRLAGQGIIAGAVTIGDGTSNKAILSPGVDGVGLLTIQSTLSFAADGSYNWNFEPRSGQADEVVAAGVTITPGARFIAVGRRGVILPLGTVFIVINNTAASPIAGPFTNLPDGGVITVNGNSLQASYEGGDGNDLTLTVVP
jgi:autotransporter-associated beta strand protein